MTEHGNRNITKVNGKTIQQVILQCPKTSYGKNQEEGFSILFTDNTLLYVTAGGNHRPYVSAGIEDFKLSYTIARDLIFTNFDIMLMASGRKMLSAEGMTMVYREAEDGSFEARMESEDHKWSGEYTTDPDELLEQVRYLHDDYLQEA